MADLTYREALAALELVPGSPGPGQQQIGGLEVIGATSQAPYTDSGITFNSLKGWILSDSDVMLKSVYDTVNAGDGIVDAAGSVNDGAGGVKSANQVVTHIDNVSLHRVINDGSTSLTALWSANKIDSELSDKANSVDFSTHTGNLDIHRELNDSLNTLTNLWSGNKIFLALFGKADQGDFNSHVIDADIHRQLTDLVTTTTNLWSASKIQGELDDKADQSAFSSHVSDSTNPHSVTHAQVSPGDTYSHAQIDNHILDNSHLSTDERAAINNTPNTPNSGNPFATQLDITASSGHVIQDESTTFTARTNLKFTGLGVTVQDDVPGDATEVIIPGGGGGGDVPEAPIDGDFYSRRNAAWEESPQTPVGGLYLRYNFNSSTVNADPGSGNIAVNNADLALATFIYVNGTTAGGNPANPAWDEFKNGDYVGVWDNLNGDGRSYFVTADPVEVASSWYRIAVTALEGGTNSITNARPSTALLIKSPANRLPQGGTAGQVLGKASGGDYDTLWQDTGDVVGPGSSTDSRLALFDGTSGVLLKEAGIVEADVLATSVDDQFSVLPTKLTPVDADLVVIEDSEAGGGKRQVPWSSVGAKMDPSALTLPVVADLGLLEGGGVHITGWDVATGKPTARFSNNGDPTTMPIVGFATADVLDGVETDLPIYGTFDYDTLSEGWAVGDRLYQGWDKLTATPPNSGEVQIVAQVVQDGKVFVYPDSHGQYDTVTEAPDNSFGYVREGGDQTEGWVRGARVFEAATEPAGLAVGDFWIEA